MQNSDLAVEQEMVKVRSIGKFSKKIDLKAFITYIG
jgi:hypothetical protein